MENYFEISYSYGNANASTCVEAPKQCSANAWCYAQIRTFQSGQCSNPNYKRVIFDEKHRIIKLAESIDGSSWSEVDVDIAVGETQYAGHPHSAYYIGALYNLTKRIKTNP